MVNSLNSMKNQCLLVAKDIYKFLFLQSIWADFAFMYTHKSMMQLIFFSLELFFCLLNP